MKCENCGYLNTPKAEICFQCDLPTGFQKPQKVANNLKKLKPKRQSDKRVTQEVLYSLCREVWITQNPRCQVKGCMAETEDVHHKRKRVGFADNWAKENNIPLLIDFRFFLSVCRTHHTEIETKPKWAKENGYSL